VAHLQRRDLFSSNASTQARTRAAQKKAFMYIPPAFHVQERAWALDLIAEYPFGLLLTQSSGAPQATHLPMLAERRGAEVWLLGHVARANPHAAAILAGEPATAIFQGPHAYVSAAWYEEPYRTVPTWNYAAVHCDGRLREGDAYRTLALLAERFEAGRPEPWRMERLDVGYMEKQLRGIVAFEMRVDSLRAKAKLGQNRTPEDRARVAAALERSPFEIERACAAAMKAAGG
jgi:transcriptional regulator